MGPVPGVVRLNEALTPCGALNGLRNGTRERTLVVLDTIAHSLSACGTVLHFLEVMYDLLEGACAYLRIISGIAHKIFPVLSYLVTERRVLHRDISWGNILINPRHMSGREDVRPPGKGSGGRKYIFVSDFLGEEK